MNIALWAVQILLAVAFAGAGVLKTTKSREELAAKMTWVEDASTGTVRLVGVSELLAAVGLILPWATGIAPILTPLAASGLVLIMVLAIVVHARKKEWSGIAVNIVLGALALFVALGRF